MPEPLVRNALTFWVSKLVLHSPAPDTYTVLETLPQQGGTTAEAQTAAAHAQAMSPAVMGAGAQESSRRATSEKLNVYRQFVVGMLTNGGPMPLDQIVGMLGMVVPGGVDFGEDELGTWLDELVEGEVLAWEAGVGVGRYKIV
jgi:anaphase-promoting complex subunit 2